MKKLLLILIVNLVNAGHLPAQEYNLTDTVNFRDKEDMQSHEMGFVDVRGYKFGIDTIPSGGKKMTDEDRKKGVHLASAHFGLNLSRGTAARFKVNTPEPGMYQLKLYVRVNIDRDLLVKCEGKVIGKVTGFELLPDDVDNEKLYSGVKVVECKVASGGKTTVEIVGLMPDSDGAYISRLEVYKAAP